MDRMNWLHTLLSSYFKASDNWKWLCPCDLLLHTWVIFILQACLYVHVHNPTTQKTQNFTSTKLQIHILLLVLMEKNNNYGCYKGVNVTQMK